MKRVGTVLRLKPDAVETYKQYHAAVWPEVLQTLRECNVRNYSIYLKDDHLFAYFEYHGKDMKADWAKMAADTTAGSQWRAWVQISVTLTTMACRKKTQEWWAIMERMQEPLPTRKEGEWWAEMEEVFHMD